MPTEKDATTDGIRTAPLSESATVVETDRADAGLTTLSFQSVSHPERHVWIDTDLLSEPVIDLEDWNDEAEWDNSVAHAVTQDTWTYLWNRKSMASRQFS